ncbi:MAG: rhomboid family intramembrane serine protease [Gemmatimonadetes bacterium]|nr:rhomboid family intramembrane serine protease [Gemmatimonadota bacterium]
MAYSPADDIEPPRMTPAVQALIAINVAIYFLQLTVVQAADVQRALGFEMRDLGRSWWTIGTYMFVHAGFWHLALNLYTLFLFGPRVERVWSTGEFTRYYLLCGLGGWLAHVVFVREGLLIGASAAVFGVMLAYAVRWPDVEVYLFGVLPLKVKWLVAILVATNLVQGLSPGGGDGTAYLAHLGGLVTGWVYLKATHAFAPEGLKASVAAAPDVTDDLPRAVPRSLPRVREKLQEIDEIIARSKTVVAKRASAAPPSPRPAVSPTVRAELDHVLDKISRDGLESLSVDERRLLEEMSKRLRGT